MRKPPEYERAMLVPAELDGATTRQALEKVCRALEDLPETEWTPSKVRSAARATLAQMKIPRAPLERAIGVATSGQPRSRGLYAHVAALGKNDTVSLVRAAIQSLSVIA